MWGAHFNTYISKLPRQAYYLYFITKNTDKNILEIAAGSFRDTALLNQWNYKVVGIDFSQKAVDLAKKQYPEWKNNFYEMDATSMTFPTESFDVSFHNGFFICFPENALLTPLIKEQIRVTKRCIVCTVHNALNSELLKLFQEKSKQDSLFDIRFYNPSEIRNILSPYCKSIQIYPFGHPVFDRLIKTLKNYPNVLKIIYNMIHPYLNIIQCERLMVVGFLR